MKHIIDLTLPVETHFRWPVERKLSGDFAKNDNFQVTWFGMGVHGFTHIDAPRHMVQGGLTTSDMSLDKVVGEAVVVNLAPIQPQTAITSKHLDSSNADIRPGDIVLLRTAWDTVESYRTPSYWREAPYITRDGCEWLLEKNIKTVGFDFPQDYPIRKLLDKQNPPISEFVSHDVLLRNGVILIEYLCRLSEISGQRVTLVALPLKIPDADGAPARVIVLEE